VGRPASPAPRIDPITLVDLTDVPGDLLHAGDARDAERYQATDLSGRDLTGIRFQECEFQGVMLHECRLRGSSFSDCVLSDVHAAVFSAPRSTWRDVRIEHSRLGSVEVYEAGMRSVHLDACKLGFVNLRNAALTDVLISNCIIDELDLGSATVQRLELQNCRIGTLDTTNARLKDVDLRSSEFGAIQGVEGLRGAIIDDSQLNLMAALLARHLGIIVR
jgi:uncharacterized protein YjbI with pentapeptide repeats